jgi:hypothetical protein
MRARRDRLVAVTVAASMAVSTTGCGRGTPVIATPASSATTQAQALEPRAQLAARVAAAKDRRYVAGYTLTSAGRPVRSVVVSVAQDATWRVDVQGGALGGTADVAIIGRPEGQYQCPLVPAGSGCVRVAGADRKLPASVDPRTQYPFTSWLDVLTDRQVALSVATATTIPGAAGTCYSVEPAMTALQPPIDSGVFCYSDDGMLTAAKLPVGTLMLVGQPTQAPPTVVLPGPVVAAQPLSTAPPPPPPSPSASANPSPSRR